MENEESELPPDNGQLGYSSPCPGSFHTLIEMEYLDSGGVQRSPAGRAWPLTLFSYPLPLLGILHYHSEQETNFQA